jgi:hypothetical protein
MKFSSLIRLRDYFADGHTIKEHSSQFVITSDCKYTYYANLLLLLSLLFEDFTSA